MSKADLRFLDELDVLDPQFDRWCVSWDPEWVAADVALYAENNERELRLWGDLLPAKRILQRRGFGVWWLDREAGLINVGYQTVSVSEFEIMSALHKRLSGIR